MSSPSRRRSGLVLEYGLEGVLDTASISANLQDLELYEQQASALQQISQLQEKFGEIARSQNAWLCGDASCDFSESSDQLSPSDEDSEDETRCSPAFDVLSTVNDTRDQVSVLMVEPADLETARRRIQMSSNPESLERAAQELRIAARNFVRLALIYILRRIPLVAGVVALLVAVLVAAALQ